MKLVFKKDQVEFSKSLSAIVRVGNDFWLGGDEGTFIFPMRSQADGTFHPGPPIKLAEVFALPGQADEKGKIPEVDLEGMDWDSEGGYLWMVASHSLKRKAAERFKDGDEVKGKLVAASKNIERLENISADGNRFLLGRLALTVDGAGNSSLGSEGTHFSARLECCTESSALLDALKQDKLLGRFAWAELPADKKEKCGKQDDGEGDKEEKDKIPPGIPGKDNGLDIEGLAWLGGEQQRLIVGLRGPVLRGMAVILELHMGLQSGKPGEIDSLQLEKIPSSPQPYLRHFLDLGGLSVRDLCVDGDDLLILAGPTQPIEWPVTIFRWIGARQKMNGSEECVAWRAPDDIVLLEQQCLPERFLDPKVKSTGRPEGMELSGDKLLIVYDGAAGERREENKIEETETVIVEEIPFVSKEDQLG